MATEASMYRIPDDVLERMYRRAVERADFFGTLLEREIAALGPEDAAELRAYIERVYI